MKSWMPVCGCEAALSSDYSRIVYFESVFFFLPNLPQTKNSREKKKTAGPTNPVAPVDIRGDMLLGNRKLVVHLH